MKKVVCAMVGLVFAFTLTACAGQSESNDEAEDQAASSTTTTDESQSSTSQTKTYESILAEYSQKLRDATPGLVEEYKQLAAENTDGLEGLAKLSNDEIEKLAKICNDGVGEMASIQLTSGSGKYEEYEEWASKLQDVYTNEAQKITDAYMKSAS